MEKASEFLDLRFRVLKSVMQRRRSYIKDSGDFINNVKHLSNISEGAILVTADVVGL